MYMIPCQLLTLFSCPRVCRLNPLPSILVITKTELLLVPQASLASVYQQTACRAGLTPPPCRRQPISKLPRQTPTSLFPGQPLRAIRRRVSHTKENRASVVKQKAGRTKKLYMLGMKTRWAMVRQGIRP